MYFLPENKESCFSFFTLRLDTMECYGSLDEKLVLYLRVSSLSFVVES